MREVAIKQEIWRSSWIRAGWLWRSDNRFHFILIQKNSAPSYKLIEVIGCFTHVIRPFPVIIFMQLIYMGTGRTNIPITSQKHISSECAVVQLINHILFCNNLNLLPDKIWKIFMHRTECSFQSNWILHISLCSFLSHCVRNKWAEFKFNFKLFNWSN